MGQAPLKARISRWRGTTGLAAGAGTFRTRGDEEGEAGWPFMERQVNSKTNSFREAKGSNIEIISGRSGAHLQPRGQSAGGKFERESLKVHD